jgi:hypothetical protein
MVDDNIYLFPRAVGPMLIEYYSKLMKEPLPQQLRDQLAMLQEACGSIDLDAPAEAAACEAMAPQGSLPDKPE